MISEKTAQIPFKDEQTVNLYGYQHNNESPRQEVQPTNPKKKIVTHPHFRWILLILCLGFMVVGWIKANQSNRILTYSQEKKVKTIESRLPRIIWIYTPNQMDSEPLENDIFLNYYVQLAQNNSYEVRYANSWNSYDWISKQKSDAITVAMSNSQIDEGVHNLLKLALLHENGGILMDWGNLFFREDFHWIEQMFDKYQEQPSLTLGCNPSESYLFMPRNHSQAVEIKFISNLMAAVPNSDLLNNAFLMLCQIMQTGSIPFDRQQKGLLWNQVTEIHYLKSAIETSINGVISSILKSNLTQGKSVCGLGMQTISQAIYNEFHQKTIFQTVTRLGGYWHYNSNSLSILYGQIFFLINVHKSMLVPYLEKILSNNENTKIFFRKSQLFQLLQVPENKKIFIDPLPQRQIELCLVVMDPLTSHQILQIQSRFNDQTYKHWKLILPTSDYSQRHNIQNPKVTIMPSFSTQVHIIEKALALHCPRKGYAVLLNKGQTFSNISALQIIAQTVSNYDVLGVILNLQINKNKIKPDISIATFTRFRDGIVNPNYEKADAVLNHFRVFAIQSFLQIPQFALRNIYGQYFKDRLIFLLDLLNLQYDPKLIHGRSKAIYMRKKFIDVWNVAGKIVTLNSNIFLKSNSWETADKQQIRMTRTRIDCILPEQFFQALVQYKVSFRKQVAYNQAKDWVSVDDRQGPDLIPRIIHQVWLGSSIPPAKQYFIDKAKKIYPQYQIKVWRQHNLSLELFPNTYDRIQTLLAFNKRSPFNKLASVTDIMRHEILYRQGGFWKDAGMNLLRPIFDKFRKFKLALPTDRLFRYRWLQGMCFFANMPGYQNMYRINNYRNLNRMRIYDNDAMNIAGPVDFRQLLFGQQEYETDLLIMPYQTFYPGQIIQHPQEDLCTKPKSELREGEQYQIQENGWILVENCEQYYPYAYAIEHNRYGNTWQTRKYKLKS